MAKTWLEEIRERMPVRRVRNTAKVEIMVTGSRWLKAHVYFTVGVHLVSHPFSDDVAPSRTVVAARDVEGDRESSTKTLLAVLDDARKLAWMWAAANNVEVTMSDASKQVIGHLVSGS